MLVSEVPAGKSGDDIEVEDAERTALDNDEEAATAREDATVTTLVAATVALAASSLPAPFSTASNTLSLATFLADDGKKRVQKKAIRILRSMSRCLRINRTMRMKKNRAAKMSIRSSQSDFSRAVMRCFEVTMRLSRTSCVVEVDFREAVDASEKRKIIHKDAGK